MTRRKLPPGAERGYLVNVRFKTGDKARLEAALSASGHTTMSEWIRTLVGRAVREQEERRREREMSYQPASQERKDLGY